MLLVTFSQDPADTLFGKMVLFRKLPGGQPHSAVMPDLLIALQQLFPISRTAATALPILRFAGNIDACPICVLLQLTQQFPWQDILCIFIAHSCLLK